MARRGHTAENNARSGRSRALRACAAKPRSFPPPRGRCAPRKSGRASPEALPVRFRRLAGRGIAPAARQLAGCCTPVRSSVKRAPQGRSPSCPSLVPFLGKQERNSLSVDYRQAPPLPERQIQNRLGAKPRKITSQLPRNGRRPPRGPPFRSRRRWRRRWPCRCSGAGRCRAPRAPPTQRRRACRPCAR